MKKTLIVLSILSVSITRLWAQTPNPGFENWTHNAFPSYDTPDGWDNANPQSAIVGIFGCIKATAAADIHSGSAAVKLSTKTILGNLAPGVVTTGTLPTSPGGSISGGIAYTLKPDSIVGWYKSAPVSGDTCFVKFMLFGSAPGNTDTIAAATFYITSTVTAYTRFSAPLIYSSSPNPVVNSIWLLSSSIDGTNGKVGSALFADDLALVINPTTAVTEQNMPEIIAGPNPSDGQFAIYNLQDAIYNLDIHTALGTKVYSGKIAHRASYTAFLNLPGGLYIYSLADENNAVVKTGKLIIQE